jgi:DNA-binding HxlR family transcriptional regulator
MRRASPVTVARKPADACPADQLLRLLRERWKTRVIYLLGEQGPLRFGELRRLLPGISPKVLTQRLRELEADALAWRQQDTMVPPRVTYGLTGMGNDVHASLKALDAPAGRWLPDR